MKPVSPSELLDAVMPALGIDGFQSETDPLRCCGASPDLPALNVLLVEDNDFNQKLAEELLATRGHKVTVAGTGIEALARLDSEAFDLILMDVEMPEMDGFEATRTIRKQERRCGKHTPIIAMTAHALKGDRERCMEAGMDDYVSKPIRSNLLFQAIERVMSEPDPTDTGTCVTDIGVAAFDPTSTDDSQVPGSSIDWDEALREFQGNKRFLLSVTEGFLEEYPNMVAAVREPIEAGKPKSLKVAAHSLKGALRYFGPSVAVEHAYRLEQMGDNACMADAHSVFRALEAEIDRLVPEMEDYLKQAKKSVAPQLQTASSP
jgi:CheY-like chemotaxis protein/HPt (histidine-containing phosphotransfer) domain-containing protein